LDKILGFQSTKMVIQSIKKYRGMIQKAYKQLVMGIVHRYKNKLNVQGTS